MEKAVRLELSEWQGSLRPLVVFAPAAADPRFKEQGRRLEGHGAELKDRSVSVVDVFEDGDSRASVGRLDEVSVKALRQRFGIGDGEFAVVLVGKDGDEKQRYHEPVSAAALCDLVDAMPVPHHV